VADVPYVAVRPPIRCCFLKIGASLHWCAAPATRQRLVRPDLAPLFLCAAHALTSDEPIADDAPFPLVVVTLEVRLCGVTAEPSRAHAEAVDALETAVASIGGVINLHACRSMTARAGRPPVAGSGNGAPAGV
jgi:hypothetical protein